ncbi:MAG: phospholipase D-like domain-containing protein [Bacteriovorax sp.]|jgi:cardiolipin synthase
MDRNFFHRSKENSIEFFEDGPLYQQRFLELIKNSAKIIHLQTYIFELDIFGIKVFNELIRASQRGVQIYLLVDMVGSTKLTVNDEDELRSAGIHFSRFNGIQIKWLYSWGRRLHHKVLLVDDEVSFIGGMNINCIIDPNTGIPQLDFAVLLRGPVIQRLAKYLQITYQNTAGIKKIPFPQLAPSKNYPEGIDVKILVNDWVYRRWQITRHYVHITKKAKHEITIINSYFFPRRSFMIQLVDAAKRGVRVRLILPKLSDWPSYILASEYLYTYFLKNGVEIYQWKKSILHGKLATIDNHWATIGSFNLNYTSYQQNLEMNVNVYSEQFTGELKEYIENLIHTGCERIDAKNFMEHCPPLKRIKRFFYYVIVALVANFSIGMIYQEDDNKGNRVYNLIRIIGAIFFLILGLLGLVLPVIPGVPFLVVSFLLVYKQILLNKKKESL